MLNDKKTLQMYIDTMLELVEDAEEHALKKYFV